jgi:signal transduction histidine kinase
MNLREMNFRDVVSRDRLRRPPLRVQLTVLYAGLFVALVSAVLGVSGLLIRHGSFGVAPGSQQPSVGTGNVSGSRSFEVWPAIVGLVGVLVAVWLAWWIAGRFLRPLQAINTAAKEISATNLHRRLAMDGPNDELTELGRTLDDLFGRLEASFESQRHFVANASHELRTPLAGQRTLLQVALADPDATSQDLRTACGEALELGAQQERLIDALLTLATSERGVEQWEPFDLGEVTRSVLAGRRNEAERLGIRIDAALGQVPASATGDSSRAWSRTSSTTPCATTSPAGRSKSRRHQSTERPSSPSAAPVQHSCPLMSSDSSSHSSNSAARVCVIPTDTD